MLQNGGFATTERLIFVIAAYGNLRSSQLRSLPMHATLEANPTRLLLIRRWFAGLFVLCAIAAGCSGTSPDDSSASDSDIDADTSFEEEPATAGDTVDGAADDAAGDDEASADETETPTIELPQDVPLGSAPGIDAETIRIGVLIRDVNQLIGSGFVEDLTVTQQVDRWRAEAGRINAAGGVQGRDLEIVVATWDPLVPESVLAACDRIATNRDAFVVLNTAGLETIASNCIIDPYSRPVIVGENPTFANFDEANGLLFSLEPAREVLAATAISRFEQAGMLQGRVAVVHADLPGDIAAADAAIGALDDLGYIVSRQEIPASQGVEAAVETLPAKVSELTERRTDTLIMMSNSTLAGPFGEEMVRYGAEWTNLIIDTDNIADPFAAARIGSAWEGTFAVGVYGGVTLGQNKVEADCRAGWDAFLNGEYNERPRGDWSFSAGLETRSTRGAAPDSFDPPGDIGYTECLLMRVVTDALQRLPLNFTVRDFVEALETGDRISMPLGGTGSFGPDEHWLADRAGMLQFLPWSSGFCPTPNRDCFVPIDGNRTSFQPLLKRSAIEQTE